MVCDVLRFDRPERTQAHMEGHVAEVYPHGLDLLQECFREVQPCRRGGGGTDLFGVDGLVPLPILQFRFDIGGQRHLSQAFQDLQKDPFVEEADEPIAIL